MSKVALAKVKSLTFYGDSLTKSRRLPPIPQLKCIGETCKSYQPEVVRCSNAGGSGTEIDWTCEADLPESLRFGQIDVSCEGWSRSGDPYVLKGSCGLEYRLIRLPDNLEAETPNTSNGAPWTSNDWFRKVFMLVWIAMAVFLLYRFINSCMRRPFNGIRPRGGPFSGSGGFSGFFGGGGGPPRYSPPPPYSGPKDDRPEQNNNSGTGPGFWTGLGLGGVGGAALSRYFDSSSSRQSQPRSHYDWEREARPRSRHMDDSGEGSSNLGSIRSSTGFGRTNVR